MAKNPIKPIGEIRDTVEGRLESTQRIIDLQKKEISGLNNILDFNKKLEASQEIRYGEQKKLNQILANENKIKSDGFRLGKKGGEYFDKMVNAQYEKLKLSDKDLKNEEKKLVVIKSMVVASREMMNVLKSAGSGILSYIVDADASMKGLNLELGLSGVRSAEMTQNFEDAAAYSARLGVNMKGLTQMASTYADETGRARLLTQESLESISLIAEGTNLGAEGAARMAGQYEMMGFNATDTAKEVQRIVDVTERMGVNTSKVLKAVNKNFKTLQKYSFRNGVSSMADMAAYAEKFAIDMNSVFEPMEKGRRLDSVIEMSAQLQVLGGQFANLSDPMSMLFESRNDPEAYMKRINEMTKGMVTLNKSADGFSFELASPMAKDQLAAAAKALGMSTEELTTQAFRMREIQQTRSQMFSGGFNKDEKELIEGLAKFDKKSGRMLVDIGGTARDVANLTKQDLEAMKTQKSTLEERALASQGFDEALKNTIMELKSSFLPLLKSMNEGLAYIRPFVTSLLETFDKGGIWVKGGMAVVAGLLMASTKLGLAFGKAKVAGIFDKVTGAGAAGGSSKGVGGKLGKGVGGKLGKGGAGAGAGIGMAAVGIGAGIGIAAVGISKLADSMAKLTPEQSESLENIAMTLAIMFPVAAIGIAAVGMASALAWGPILAVGAAVLMMGGGIALAAVGIGYMAKSFASLDNVNLDGIGNGMLKFAGAALMLGNPIGILGLGAMALSVHSIAGAADDLKKVGDAFFNIAAVLNGDTSQFKEVKDMVNSIASIDMSSNGFSGLASILSKPLTVQFADKDIAFNANIDLSIGGDNFYKTLAKRIPIETKRLQQGGNS